MKIEIINNVKDFLALENDWNMLLNKCNNNFVFLTFEWLCAWWESRHRGKDELFIILVKDNEKLLAAVPLMVKNMQIFKIVDVRKLQFVGHEVSDYMDFIIAEKHEECFQLIFNELARSQKLWDWAEFIFIPKNSPNFPYWKKYFFRFKSLRKSFKSDSVSIALNMYKRAQTWNEFEKTLPKKKRNDLKRCLKLLSEIGNVSFVRSNTPSEIGSAFSSFIESHKKRWKNQESKSLFNNTLNISYYSNVAQKLSSKGWVEITSLKVNGNPIAMALGYLYNDTYYYYLPAFNPEYARFSPGSLLIKNLLETFYNEGRIKKFDLLRGNERYKNIWGNEQVILFRIILFPMKINSFFILLHVQFRYLLLFLKNKLAFFKKNNIFYIVKTW